MEDLTPEQTEKILHFQEITALDDINNVKDRLIRNNWDIESAFNEYSDLKEGLPSLYASSNSLEARPPIVINDRFLQHIFLNQNRNSNNNNNNNGFFGVIGYLVNYIFNLCYSTLSSFIQTFLSIFSDRDRRIVTDALGDVTKFIDDYNTKYPVHPVFYRGTYSQALNDAKRELKFLLVYLHSETNSPISTIAQASQQKITETVNFCRNTLSNEEVIEYINRNMLFWACDVSSPEGYRVSHSIQAKTYPIMVIIGLRSNKMIIMGRMEGECKPEELMRRLRTVVSENEVWLNQARNIRLERSLTQTIRQQQDVAFEESLRADQEKERKRQQELEEQRKVLRALEEEKLAEERKKQLIEELKLELATQVPSEPSENSPNAISIVFKLPNGLRITRRFSTTDSLHDIHNFIFCHPHAPDSFEITQNFPKRVLNCGKLNLDGIPLNGSLESILNATKDKDEKLPTVGEAGLTNREVLFVSDLDA